jgi:hypothetical protein
MLRLHWLVPCTIAMMCKFETRIEEREGKKKDSVERLMNLVEHTLVPLWR